VGGSESINGARMPRETAKQSPSMMHVHTHNQDLGGGGNTLRGCARAPRFIALIVSCLVAVGVGCGPGVEPGAVYNGYAGTCPGNQRKVCLGKCAQVANRVGAGCDLDPCPLASGASVVCGTGLRCAPDSAGALTGTCQPIPDDPGVPPRLGACNPAFPLGSAQNPCGQFTVASDARAGSVTVPSFCRPIGDDNTTCTPTSPSRAACNPTRIEGESCDGEWEELLAAAALPRRNLCAPCGPGFRCANSVTGGPRVCLRRCDPVVGGQGACRPAGSNERPWTYQCQTQPLLRPLGTPSMPIPSAAVCIRVGNHLGVCGASIASFETRQLVSIAPPINVAWDNGDTRIVPDAYGVYDRTQVLNAPLGVPNSGCSAACDNCVVTQRVNPPDATSLAEATCCVDTGGRCGTGPTLADSDCCDFGSFDAQCVRDPQSGATGAGQQGLCRRGCSPALGGNLTADICSGRLPPNPPFPANFQCPGATECIEVDRTPPLGGTTLPIHACTPCGRAGEPRCTVSGREGCTIVLGPAQIPGGGIVRMGNLQVDANGICQPVTIGPTGALVGGPGQPCHAPNVRVGAICGSGPRLPQGDRCNLPNFACSDPDGPGTCVPCGLDIGQPACEGAISLIGARVGGIANNPTVNNSICAETRLPFNDPTESLRCPGDPPRINPPRCVENALGNRPRIVSAPARNRYSGEAGVCIACGNTGQPCCESQLCQNVGDTCDQGVCTPCGQQRQPCCRCNPNLSMSNGCAATNPQGEFLQCRSRTGRPGVCETGD
jgi:hypothetical protein